LPKDQQDALLKAAAAAEPRGWEMSKAREKEGDETLAKNGVSVNEPSAEIKSALAKIGDQMAAEWEKSAGPDGQAILKAYRSK
jgi:TRAP-type C4-dicarboxylate transport system substrate-binding protein